MNAADRIGRARSALILRQPFFGCLALHLEPAERPDLTDTMATDGRHLFSNAAFVETLSDAELEGVIAHEVMHCALGHHARIGNRDLPTFNAAADYALNPELIKAGFTLPAGVLINPAFDGLSAEEIYALLQQPSADQKQGQQGGASPSAGAGQPGNGNAPSGPANGQQQGNGQPSPSGQPSQANGGAGAPGTGHGMGGVLPAGGAADQAAELDRWQVMARQAVNIAKAHNAGTVPGYLQGVVKALQAPRADFRELLAQFIDSRVAWDYSFQRPNRRLIHAGVYMPGQTIDGLEHVVCAIDTSGSITADMLATAAAEIGGAMEAGKIARVTVLMADTRVCHVEEFHRGERVELVARGGGGTDFRDTFRWISDNAPDASAVVYLTDLIVDQFGQDPGCPVLWATHGDSRRFPALAARVPFGEPVYIGR